MSGEDEEKSAPDNNTTTNIFDLPNELLEVLPSDPFAQLDVARKITSIALSSRVSALESDTSSLRYQVNEKDKVIDELQSQIESLEATLSETAEKLTAASQQKETLVKENALLSNTVRKLNRDVSKLEVFRKTLMRSLQEDEDGSSGQQNVVAPNVSSNPSSATHSQAGDDDVTLPLSAYSSTRSHVSDSEDRIDGGRLRISQGLLLSSQTNTPRFTPPGSPPVMSASASPSRTSKPASPRWHSVSFSTSRGLFDSMSSSHNSSFSSYDSGSARARVDGKEFFRQVRSRISYEQFGAFLATVKELNAHKQTKEDTLRKAEEIFGSDNKDLYTVFEGLLSRNVS